MNWGDPTIDAGIIQAAATAVPGTFVAFFAWRALRSWRDQLLGGRRVEHAEACLIAADAFLAPVRGVRIGLVRADKAEVDRPGGLDEAIRRRDEAGLKQAMDALGVLRQAYRRASFFIQMPEPDPFALFESCLRELVLAYRQAAYWDGVGDIDEQYAREQRARARAIFLGQSFDPLAPGAKPETDPIEARLVQAMDLLESVLLPILGGGKRPAIGVGSAITAVAKLLATGLP